MSSYFHRWMLSQRQVKLQYVFKESNTWRGLVTLHFHMRNELVCIKRLQQMPNSWKAVQSSGSLCHLFALYLRKEISWNAYNVPFYLRCPHRRPRYKTFLVTTWCLVAHTEQKMEPKRHLSTRAEDNGRRQRRDAVSVALEKLNYLATK